MASQVNELYRWDVIGTQGRLVTVIAPNEETAKDEARKALSKPGRELSYMAWVSNRKQVKRK